MCEETKEKEKEEKKREEKKFVGSLCDKEEEIDSFYTRTIKKCTCIFTRKVTYRERKERC